MSVSSLSEPSALPSRNISRDPVQAPSRLHVRLMVEKPLLSGIVAEVIRLADRHLPNAPHFLVVDGNCVTLRIRQVGIRVCQTDMLVCRLTRVRGIRNVSAEQRKTPDGIIYRAVLRGRSWNMVSTING